jgi:inorganic pyrophosphatase
MIRVCIEAEAGSREKQRFDEQTLAYQATRRVAQPYPYPYGFILGTHAADRDGIDCHIITRQRLVPGTLVVCEPLALLEQSEDDEVDHKVLAALPGESVDINQELHRVLRDFIYALFAPYPSVGIRVGHLLPRETALLHIQAFLPGRYRPEF